MATRGHRAVEHTADLAFEVWAPDEPQLLEEAAQAVVAVMIEGAPVVGVATRPIALVGFDAEERLVTWLNEVIFWATVEGFLVAEATLRVEGEALVGEARGEPEARAKLTGELKAATYHDLHVRRTADGVRARVVLDV
ncbi:MAG: archease [Myxococcales bacterium]|nr:archease [Myxococcales bacterium]